MEMFRFGSGFGRRFRGLGGVLLGVSLVLALGGLSARADERQAEDRLQVDVYVGEVINSFSSSARKNYVNPSLEDESGDIQRVAGLRFDYLLRGERGRGGGAAGSSGRGRRLEVHVFGEAMHSARVLEERCSADDPVCRQSPIFDENNPDDFLKIVEDTSVLEWFGGLRLVFPGLSNEETSVYVKAQGGFIRAAEARDDVIDNHFVGLGLEHIDPASSFSGSYLELGWGRTDLFDRATASSRFKLNAELQYRPSGPSGIMSFFARGRFDSDLGPGSDDIQLYFGLSFDMENFFAQRGSR